MPRGISTPVHASFEQAGLICVFSMSAPEWVVALWFECFPDVKIKEFEFTYGLAES